MNLLEHDGPKAQAHLAGLPGAPLFFSQVRDVVAYMRMPEQSHEIVAVWVNDMGAPDATLGRAGRRRTGSPRGMRIYVVGARVVGGMGAPELVPFSTAADAPPSSPATNGGEVMRLDEIPDSAVLAPVELTDGDAMTQTSKTACGSCRECWENNHDTPPPFSGHQRRRIALSAFKATLNRSTLGRARPRGAGDAASGASGCKGDWQARRSRDFAAGGYLQPLPSRTARYRASTAASGLAPPPFELLECLSLAGAVHRASEGRFDPTIQTLWTSHADADASGIRHGSDVLDVLESRTGWDKVRFDAAAITLRPGMALTLNGIAQGYRRPRRRDACRGRPRPNILIDTGEFARSAGRPGKAGVGRSVWRAAP